jgi:hypothetical protein
MQYKDQLAANIQIQQDFLNGKTIQYKLLHNEADRWDDATITESHKLVFDFQLFEYRVKPKTRKVTLYLNLHKSGSVFASDDEKWMREHGNQLCHIIAHPIEVEIPDVREE